MARKIEVQIIGDSSSFEKSLARASGSSSSFGSSISKLSKLALLGGTALGAGFAVGAGKAISAAGNFQSALNTLQAVSGATSTQMAKVSSLSMKLGADLTLPATSAKDAADAMTELSKAGLSMSDTMAAAKGVLQLSAAAEISNSDAAMIAANALNAFGLKGGEAGKVADLLAAASIAASGSMTDMADALKMTSSTAAQAHIPIQDVVTAIGELANKGIMGGEAGAALQQMLLKLESPTKKGAAAMKQLGISIYDAHGAMKPMRSLIEQFSTATKGMSDAQRNAAMNALFGSRAIRAANIVLLSGVSAYDKMHDAVGRQGAAADLAAAKMKGFNGAIQGLKSQAETAAILLGSALLPSATKFINGINNLMADLMKAHTFRAKLNVLWDFGTSIADALEKAWSGVNFGTIASHNTSGAGMSTGIQGMITGAFANVDWTGVGVTIADGISTGIGTAGNIAKKIVTVIDKAMGSIDWNKLGRTAGPGLAAAVVSAFATLLDPGFWIKNWDLALAVASVAFGGVIGRVAGKFGVMLTGPLGRALGDGVLKVAGSLEKLSPKLADALLSGLLKLPALATSLLGKLASPLSAATSKLGKLLQFTVKVLGVDAAIRAVASLAASIGNAVAGWAAAGAKLGKAVVDGIWNGLKAAWNKVSGWFSARPAAIVAAFGAPEAILAGIGVSVISGLWSGLKSKWNDVAGWLGGLGGKIKSLKGPEAKDSVLLNPEGIAIISGLLRGMQSAWSAAAPWIGTIAPKISAALANVDTSKAEANLARLAASWTKLGAALTPAETQLAAMQAAEDARSRAQALNQAQDDLAKAQQIKNVKDRNAAVIAAEQQLQAAQLAITTARLTATGAAERAGVDKQVAAHLAAIDRMKTAIQQKTDAMGAAFSKLGEFISRAFGAKTQQGLDQISKRFDAQIAKIQAWQQQLTAGEQALKAFDAAGSGGPTASEQQLSTLDASEADRSRQLALQQAQAELVKAQAVADVQERATAVAAAEEQVRSAQLAIQRAALETQAGVERAARDQALADQRAALQAQADQERTARDEVAANKIAALEASRQAELDNYTELRRQQEEQLNGQLAELQAQLAKHPGQWRKINKQILTLLDGYGVDLRKSGETLGKAFADGLDRAADDVARGARNLAQIVAKYLKLNSPAELGPLSDNPAKWLAPLGGMLASGMDGRPIALASAAMAGAARVGGSGSYAGAGGANGNVVASKLDQLIHLLTTRDGITVEQHYDTAPEDTWGHAHRTVQAIAGVFAPPVAA